MTPAPDTVPALSVVIPSYRAPDLVLGCLRSVEVARGASAHEIEVIVVDDGSGDHTAAAVAAEFPDVAVVALPENRGYPAAVNAGIRAARAEWVLTLNNDTTVDPGLFDELLAVALVTPDLGLAAAQQRFSADPQTIYSAGQLVDRAVHVSDRLIGQPLSAGEREPVEVFGACGAAALYRRRMLDAIGGFDELFEFGLEDADVAWRARMGGWRCLYIPSAIVYHDLGGTVGHGSSRRLYQAGRNRWLLIAKNLDARQLLVQLPWIAAFDIAYVAYATLRFRSLASLRGRIAATRLWRPARLAGAPGRKPIELTGGAPLRAALRRRRLWRKPSEGAAVLVINQYAPPDTASTATYALAVAAALAATGRPVTFLAGQPSYTPGQRVAPRRELLDDVELVRVALPRQAGRTNFAARLAGYGAFLARVALGGRRLARRGGADTVVCFHNPPLLPLLGVFVAGRRRLIAVVLDIHPDVVLASGWRSLPAPLVRVWDELNRWALRRAERVVVLSQEMREVLAAKGIDPAAIEVVPMWAEPELSPTAGLPAGRRRSGAQPDEFLIFVGGNIGVSQRLEPVLETARLLAGERVRWCVVGSGVNAGKLHAGLEAVGTATFLPRQSDAEYAALIATADAALVSLAAGLERLLVPSRAFPPLSAGVPLLAVMDAGSEVGRLVTATGAGVCSTDPEVLAAAVRRWIEDPAALAAAGEAARAAYLASGGRAASLHRYVEIIGR